MDCFRTGMQDFKRKSRGRARRHFDTAGDKHLGGEDFDNQVVDYCMQDFKRNFVVKCSGKMCHRAAENAANALSRPLP